MGSVFRFRRAGSPFSLLKNPSVATVENFGDKRQVVSSEAGGIPPVVAILINSRHRHIVPGSIGGVILPNGGTDAAQTNFLRGLGFWLPMILAFQKENECSSQSEVELSVSVGTSSS